MGKRSDVSPKKKTEIKTLLQHCKYSQRKIAEMCKVSQSTVRNISKAVQQGESMTPKPSGKCGRKRITTPRDERKIQQITIENRNKPRKVIRDILEEAGVTLSDMTLRRRWKEQNFSCRRPLKKPKLTPVMRLKRLEFAKKYKHWTAEDWHKVCFSDESSIQILQDHTQFVRRRPNEKFKEDCIVERVKHPLSIMIWGVISAKGNGRLYIVENTMRQDQYIKVLSEKLIPQTSEWFPNKDFLFMHDSAPCHKAKKVTKFLNDHQIKVLEWPGNSPDLNPIENVWAALKKEIAKEKVITNKQELIEKVIKAWFNTPELKTISKNCIDSMPRRLQEVIAQKGGFTKY